MVLVSFILFTVIIQYIDVYNMTSTLLFLHILLMMFIFLNVTLKDKRRRRVLACSRNTFHFHANRSTLELFDPKHI